MRLIEYEAGVILWRPVTFVSKDKATMDVLPSDFFDDGESDQKICRASVRVDGQHIWEPLIVSINERGMVVFVDSPLPENFTHLVVKALSRNGQAIFAKAPEPFPEADYLDFRERMAAQVRDGRGLELFEKAETVKEIPVPGEWSRRIIYDKKGEWVRGKWVPDQVMITSQNPQSQEA